MRSKLFIASLVLLGFPALALAAATIKALTLADGHDESNHVSAMFDGTTVPPLRIEAVQAGFDSNAKIVRRGGGGMFTKGPEYNLGPTVKPADLLTEALRAEASAMGLRAASGDESAWVVKATLKDVYAESRQVYMGATLFYGYMDVEFEVQGPRGEPTRTRLRAHNYYGAYNAGGGRKDEAQEGVAHLLVEGAQEMLARLNRAHFKAPLLPEMVKRVESLHATSSRNDVHLIGLSGAPGAAPALVQLLGQTQDENQRTRMIEALANTGSREVVAALAGRYAKEDEDCRWAILKAMDYIGGAEALAVIKDKGTKDEHEPCKRLAQRLQGT